MSAGSCCRFQQVQVTDRHNRQGYEKQTMHLWLYICVCVCISMCTDALYRLVVSSAFHNRNKTLLIEQNSVQTKVEWNSNVKKNKCDRRRTTQRINCKVCHSKRWGKWHENVSKLAHLFNIPTVYRLRLDTWNSCFLQEPMIRKICFWIHRVHVLLLAGNEVDSSSQWCMRLDPMPMQQTHQGRLLPTWWAHTCTHIKTHLSPLPCHYSS